MLFLEHAMQKFNLNKNIAKIHSIETFGSVDGPGVRFVVFLNGCHMRCKFCHNPDTWDINGGEERTSDELLTQALKYKTYWKSGGGITVSGGEPLIQIDFLNEFFKKAKAKGVHVTLDTSGNPFTREEPFFSKFKELMNVTDLVILDIKEIDESKHKKLTGWSNLNILDMAKYLSEINKPVWIRHVLVPGGSDNDEELIRLNEFIKTLSNVDRVEVIPYHDLGIFKWEKLGIAYPLINVKPPTKERIENAKKLLYTSEYRGYLSR